MKRSIQYLEKSIPDYVRGISTVTVVMTFKDNQLHILLSKLNNLDLWMLPLGFVYKTEGIDDAAKRQVLNKLKGKHIHIEQYKTFGDKDRIASKEENSVLFNQLNNNSKIIRWMSQRFITIGYLCYVKHEEIELKTDMFSETTQWVSINKLPKLIFDNPNVVSKAIKHVRTKVNHMTLADSMLPEKFTMKELQALYEELTLKKVDRGNFQKKALKIDILERHEKMKSGNAHRAPYLYSFKKQVIAKLNDSKKDIIY